MPPTAVFRRCLRATFSPAGGIVAAALGLLILLGCLSIGGTSESHAPPDTDHTFQQEGSLDLGPGQERDVYFPIPYVSPPYLEMHESNLRAGTCALLAQQPTHFRVQNTTSSPARLEWKARGVKGKVTQTIIPGPPALPAEPVPAVPAESTAKER
jgi:hypothetical protein